MRRQTTVRGLIVLCLILLYAHAQNSPPPPCLDSDLFCLTEEGIYETNQEEIAIEPESEGEPIRFNRGIRIKEGHLLSIDGSVSRFGAQAIFAGAMYLGSGASLAAYDTRIEFRHNVTLHSSSNLIMSFDSYGVLYENLSVEDNVTLMMEGVTKDPVLNTPFYALRPASQNTNATQARNYITNTVLGSYTQLMENKWEIRGEVCQYPSGSYITVAYPPSECPRNPNNYSTCTEPEPGAKGNKSDPDKGSVGDLEKRYPIIFPLASTLIIIVAFIFGALGQYLYQRIRRRSNRYEDVSLTDFDPENTETLENRYED